MSPYFVTDIPLYWLKKVAIVNKSVSKQLNQIGWVEPNTPLTEFYSTVASLRLQQPLIPIEADY